MSLSVLSVQQTTRYHSLWCISLCDCQFIRLPAYLQRASSASNERQVISSSVTFITFRSRFCHEHFVISIRAHQALQFTTFTILDSIYESAHLSNENGDMNTKGGRTRRHRRQEEQERQSKEEQKRQQRTMSVGLTNASAKARANSPQDSKYQWPKPCLVVPLASTVAEVVILNDEAKVHPPPLHSVLVMT